ncbi:MAG: 3-phosphoshikimate 1-carboxyvinyltransferase [Planctomycetota bacterium]
MEKPDLNTLRRPLAELPDPLPIPSMPSGAGASPARAVVRPPGSKSLTNRAFLLAGLAPGESVLRHPLLEADDAQRMMAALTALGCEVTPGASEVRVRGVGGKWNVGPEGVTVNLNNAGTATRFLCAAALASPGPITIDGNARMRQRPIGELTELLESVGATIEHTMDPGCPPVRITPPAGGVRPDGPLEIGQTQSSQFISALLLVAPFLPAGLTLRLVGDITSSSYVRMTVNLLEKLGANIRTAEDLRVIRIMPGFDAFEYDVEPDASGATYFWAAGALLPNSQVGVRGLTETSFQGDAHFHELLGRMGARISETSDDTGDTVFCHGPGQLRPVMADMADMPDATMTLAACCAFAPGTSILRGVRTLRVKETDRIAALRIELAKLGVTVTENLHGDDDVMSIDPPEGGIDCSPDCPPVHFDTYDDHRMAMSMALIGLRRPNVFINDPACVAKTYPTYFGDLAKLYE